MFSYQIHGRSIPIESIDTGELEFRWPVTPKGDENYGFRSVAIGIGLNENMWIAIRQILLQELDHNEIFYTDLWLNDGFRLIRLDPDPNCVVIDWFVNGEWNLKWSRPIVSGRNLDYLISLNSDLEQISSFTGRDEVGWELGNNATFTVKETREHIDDNILPTLDAPTIWCKSVPRKVNIFLWRLHLDRLPTRLNLSKRGLDIPSITCLICSNDVESNDHIFYSCEVAASIWCLVDESYSSDRGNYFVDHLEVSKFSYIQLSKNEEM
ncbi:RNA-directed DNA polymerase, eukaryota [Tanacetum coccineum]